MSAGEEKASRSEAHASGASTPLLAITRRRRRLYRAILIAHALAWGAITLLGAELWARHSQGYRLGPLELEPRRFSDRELAKIYNRQFGRARPDFFRDYPYDVEWFEAGQQWSRYLFRPSVALNRNGDHFEPAREGDVPYWSSNSFGFRGPEIRKERTPGVPRIVCLGASTTEGSQGDDETYPHFLAQQLGSGTEVINAGHHGHDLRDLIAIFQQRVVPLQPDVVILYAAANNIDWTDHLRYVPCGPRGCWPLAYPEWSRWFLRHSALLDVLLARSGPPPPLWHGFSVDRPLPSTERHRRRLEQIAGLARGAGITLVFTSFVTLARPGLSVRYAEHPRLFRDFYRKLYPLTPGEIARIYARYNRIAEATAERRGLPFADIAARFPREFRYFSLGDHFHLSPRGNRLMARLLADFLVEHGLLDPERVQAGAPKLDVPDSPR